MNWFPYFVIMSKRTETLSVDAGLFEAETEMDLGVCRLGISCCDWSVKEEGLQRSAGTAPAQGGCGQPSRELRTTAGPGSVLLPAEVDRPVWSRHCCRLPQPRPRWKSQQLRPAAPRPIASSEPPWKADLSIAPLCFYHSVL